MGSAPLACLKMAVYEIFSQSEIRRYKTHICSKATILQFCIALLTFIPPLLVVYRSQGFWLKFAEYHEQPEIHYQHELIMMAELENDYLTWSTYQNYNNLQMEKLRLPLIKSRENDINKDGKADELLFEMEMPLLDSEAVVGITLLMFFNYRLHKFSQFEMESLGLVQYSSNKPGSRLQVTADLVTFQRDLLAHRGLDTRFNASVIDPTSTYAESYDLGTILKTYASRNVTTKLENEYSVWTSGRAAGSPFKLNVHVRYPEEKMLYQPGFWQLIKWGWVQYVSVLLVFLFVFNRITCFIFQNQLVPTIVERPWKANKVF